MKGPTLPKPPNISKIIRNNPVRGALRAVKDGMVDIKDGVSEIVESLRPESGEEEASQIIEKPTESKSLAPAVTDKETIKYQDDHLTDELNLIESHLTEGCSIAGKACDCCQKAAKRISAYAREAIPIAARQGKDTTIYEQATEWAEKLKPVVTRDAVNSGEYANLYKVESGNASKLRKAIESGQPCSTCIQPLSNFLNEKGG